MYHLLLPWRTPDILRKHFNNSPMLVLFSTCGRGLQLSKQNQFVKKYIQNDFIISSGPKRVEYVSLPRFLHLNTSGSFSLPKYLHTNPIQSECKIRIFTRQYCSALFITNDKLSKLCSNVSPAFDIAQVLSSKENVVNNLKRRKLNPSEYDFAQIQEHFDRYVSIENKITELEYKVIVIEDFLHCNKTNPDISQMEEKKQERKELKAEINFFDEFLLNFQKAVIIKVLKLPNELDANTPDAYATMYQFDPVSTSKEEQTINYFDRVRKHVRYTNKLDINYEGTAARFEYLFPILLKNYFIAKHNYIPFTNTDLCKGVIVEGCGTPYMCPWDNVVLVNNETDPGEIGYDERRYHLVGSSHMSMFCAYHTNHSVSSKDLPLKYVASGKQYGFHSLIPEKKENSKEGHPNVEDLYNSVQKETVNLFVGTDSRENLVKELDQLHIILKSFFSNLNIRHRVCQAPASCLRFSESSRVEYQVFSDSLLIWVTCVDVCVSGDYISKRLSMCHHRSATSYDRHYLHVLNANVYVNVLLVNQLERGETLDLETFKNRLNIES